MVDGQLRQAVDLAPGCRPGLELLDQLGLRSVEFLPEQVAEQVMVVVPLALPVQRNTQRIDALQRLQGVAATSHAAEPHNHSLGGARSSVERRMLDATDDRGPSTVDLDRSAIG